MMLFIQQVQKVAGSKDGTYKPQALISAHKNVLIV